MKRNVIILFSHENQYIRRVYKRDTRLIRALESKEYKIYRDYQFENINHFDKMPRIYN